MMEYGGCSVRKRSRPCRCATHCASTMSEAGKVDEPIARTLPLWTRSDNADRVSSTSTVGSGRWIWYRSRWSVPNRRNDSSTAVVIQRREFPRRFGSSPIG